MASNLRTKRSSRSRRSRSNVVTVGSSSGSFIPPVLRTKLRWGGAFSTATGTSYINATVSVNDCHDPGLASFSTQPIGFGALATLYGNYRCYGSSIRVRVCHAATSSGVGSTAVNTIAVCWPSFGSTTVNDINSALAQPWAKSVNFDIGGNKEMRTSCRMASLVGLRAPSIQNGITAQVVSSPTYLGIWNIAALSSAAQTGVNVVIELELIYDVEFFSPVSPDLAMNEDYKLISAARAAREKQREIEKKAQPVPTGVGSQATATVLAAKEVKCEGKEQARKEPESKPVATLRSGWSLL